MKVARRLLLIPAGFILAMAFNVCRMTFLTMVAAKKGVAAIDQYHDPAGIVITIVCTAGLWGLAVLFKKKLKTETLKAESGKQEKDANLKTETLKVESKDEFQLSTFPISASAPDLRPLSAGLFPLSLALLAWLFLVEVGVESWYRWHEVRLPKSASWSMEWPRGNPTFSELAIGDKATQMLRYDEASSVAWRENDGSQWQMIYLRWLPGRIAVDLAKMHTPEACLKAAGGTVEALPDLKTFPIDGLKLPFREYVLAEPGGSAYVFYCLWEDRPNEQLFQGHPLTLYSRLGPVLDGRRNLGERSLEVVVRGFNSLEDAQNALKRQIDKLIKLKAA